MCHPLGNRAASLKSSCLTDPTVLIQQKPQKQSAYLTQHTLLWESCMQVRLKDSKDSLYTQKIVIVCVCVRRIMTPSIGMTE